MRAGHLGSNVVASIANALAIVVSSLLAVPLILDAVGTAGYGAWALGLAVVVYVSLADAGLGPGIQRFTAIARGAGDEAGTTRLLWTMLLGYAAVGALALVALNLAAPWLVDLFDLPAGLRPDAEEMFRILGIAVAVALLASGAGHLLAGLERFRALALSSAAGALAFVVAVAALAEERGLPGLATALIVQHAVVLAIRLWAVRGLARTPGPQRPRRAEVGSIVRFSAPLQLSALADLINSQSDKIVVGLVASLVTVGELGIGAQFADGGRLVAAAALGPVISAFAVTAGAADPARLKARFSELHRTWVLGVLGAAIIGAASLPPVIDAWLGPGHGEAALLGAVLVLAAAAGLATGSGIAYLRAIGRPGIEARYGAVVVAANVGLTIPLALVAGARGVVLGTLGAYLIGGAWFFARLARHTRASPLRDHRDGANALATAVLAAAASVAWGELAVQLLPGRAAFPVAAAGALAALAAYAALVLELRPTRAGRKRAPTGV